MLASKFIAAGLVFAAYLMLGAGCSTLDGLAFGLDVANAETTMSVSYGDGKGVIAAEQGGNRVGFNVRR